MDKELIKQFALSSKYYSFKISNYIIPLFLINKSGQKINLEFNRSKELSKTSSYLSKFLNDIKEVKSDLQGVDRTLFEYIREFPIIIDDRELWNDILDLYGASKDCEYRNKLYFLVDLFFPISSIFVEIDSNYHDSRLMLDKIRDKYMKCRYGIKTLRFYEYGNSTISRRYDFEYFKDTILKESKLYLEKVKYNGSLLYIDYSNIIVNNFIRLNSGSLDYIDRLRSYVGSKSFNLYDKIILTKKDLRLIDSPQNNLIDGIFINDNQRDESIRIISEILRDVFKKKLIIHNSEDYTVKDVIWAMEMSTNQNKWSRFLGTTAPQWIVDIFGYPPIQCIESPDKRYRIEIENRKSDVMELVKFLTSEKP